jgi:hypothetical protein
MLRFLLLLLLYPASLVAQSNTASITGHVLDPQHHPVANAQVVITNTDLNTKRTIKADASGSFRADGLPPGAFTLEASAPSLKTRRPARVTLGLGSSVTVDLALAIPAVRSGTTVSARGATSEGNTLAPPVNKQEASVSNFFTGNTVTYLPNRDRDFTQFGQLGGAIAEDPSGEGIDIAGQRATATANQVDGVSFNDPLHGGRRGASDGVFLLPQTTVREFQIVRSGITAEVDNTNAGLINVATKEGSNHLRAEAFYTVRPTWATSADAFGHPLDNRQNTFGGSLGFPLRKDKFFLYAGFEQDLLQAPFYTQFAPQAAGLALPASLTALQGQVIQHNTPTALSLRGDATLDAHNSLNLQLVFNHVGGSNINRLGSSRSLATGDNSDHLSGQSLWSKAALTTLLNERSVNQLLVSWSGDHRNLTPNSTAPEVNINGFGSFGGDSLGPHLYTSQQLQLLDTVSITRGARSLSLGGAFHYDPAYELEEANLNGRFDFNSLASYLAGQPRRYQQTFVTGNTRYQASVRTAGLFADAKAPLGHNVTLTAGLRWDGQFNPEPPHPNALALQTQRIPNDLAQWQPRAGLAYSPAQGALKHTVMRASSGLYEAPTPATLFHRVFADNGTQTVVADTYLDPQILSLVLPGMHSLPTIPSGLSTPEALVYGIDPAFRNPRSFQATVTVEQELHPGYSVSAGYLHNATWRLERRLDLNLFAPTTSVAGLPIFPTARPNTGIGRLLTEESDAHSSYNGLLLTSTSQIGRRSSLNINYTLSHTRDDDSNNGPYSIDSAVDPFSLQSERGFSSLDVRHVLNISAIFNLPLGLKANPLFLARSGRPYTPIVGFDTQHDANDFNDRAQIDGLTAPRNIFRQPAFADLDLRLVKDFTLKGTGHHLDLFMDVFNLTGAGNRSFGAQSVSFFGNAASPVASAGQALFAPDGTRIGGPREIQFTARLVAF